MDKAIVSCESSKRLQYSSSITNNDRLFFELHNINVKPGDIVNILFDDGIEQTIEILEVNQYGTMWFKVC